MNKFTKRDIGQKYENNGRMNDPGIKMNICPSQRDESEQTGQDQTYKGKIGFNGYGQNSHPKALKEKTCEDNQE
jgi:hypothetical protein